MMSMEAKLGRAEKRLDAERLARIRLLSDELDRLRISALERTRSIDTKASFVVVASGVVAAAAFSGLDRAGWWWIGLFPAALIVATVIVAAVALWPVKLDSASGRDMVDVWVDDDIAPADLEDALLEVKAVEIEYRDAKNESKAASAKWAFGLLVASLVAALTTAALDAAIPNGDVARAKTVVTTTAPHPTEAP